MARRILLHEDFLADARRHEDWLVRSDNKDWLVNLLGGIEEVAALLQRFPAIGPVLAEDERLVLRSFPLRRFPYVVWFSYLKRRRIGDVWLLRLFGAHQDRPSAYPGSWKIP